MIKIFRNLRHQLFHDSPFTRYLLYALGEIILVVIGILIALQINNWNESQKGHRQGLSYLQDLERDLQSDITTLEERITGNGQRLQNIDSILHQLRTRKELTAQDIHIFLERNISLTSESYFVPETSTIKQIESSSSGDLIRNKEVRDQIFRYYSNNERSEKNMEVSLQLYQHHFITEKIAKGALNNKYIFQAKFGVTLPLNELNINALADNEDYLFALLAKSQATSGQNAEYRKLKSTAENILSKIKEVLDDSR